MSTRGRVCESWIREGGQAMELCTRARGSVVKVGAGQGHERANLCVLEWERRRQAKELSTRAKGFIYNVGAGRE